MCIYFFERRMSVEFVRLKQDFFDASNLDVNLTLFPSAQAEQTPLKERLKIKQIYCACVKR